MENKHYRPGRRQRIRAAAVKTVTALVSLFLLFTAPALTLAGEAGKDRQNDPGDINRNVVMVESRLMDGEDILKVRGGSGFFVRMKDSGIYVITALGNSFSDEELQECREERESEKRAELEAKKETESYVNDQDVSVEIKRTYRIRFGDDIDAEAVQVGPESRKRQVLVLAVESLKDQSLGLRLSGEDEEKLQKITVHGFPHDVNGHYSSSNVAVYTGTIVEEARENQDGFLRFQIDGEGHEAGNGLRDHSMRGSAVVDERGILQGVYLGSDDGHYGKAAPVSSVREMLTLTTGLGQPAAETEEVPLQEENGKSLYSRPRYIYILGAVALFMAVFTALKLILDASRHSKEVKENQAYGTKRLFRVNTNETILIDSEKFIVGSNPRTCSYAVTDNASVEPVHFCILKEGRVCSLVDMNSNTGTKLDKKTVRKGLKIRLKNKAVIQAGSEKFIFLT